VRKNLKVGLVGATGMVGQTFIKLLNETQFPISEVRPFASESSLGKKVEVQGSSYPIQTLKEGCFVGLDAVFFSSGDDISLEWGPKAVNEGAYVVDNSAAFRMDPSKLLCVPEVNGQELKSLKSPALIANPNCSTIQLVVALKPLRDLFGLESVHVATYQAVSGAGQPAYDELVAQVKSYANNKPMEKQIFPHQIAFNLIPQIGSFQNNGFSSEEIKVIKETKKILSLPELRVSSFTVRVPVLNSHSEAVWVRLKSDTSREKVLAALAGQAGVVVEDSTYPMPILTSDKNPVFVGRVHQDLDDPKTWIMWIVADNIRKGAAWNGLQIAAELFDIKLNQ
jgi:aspartate-semialdehyde dehydrogenase